MIIRLIEEKDVETVSNLIIRNFDEVMSKYHSKEIIEKYKSHSTPEHLISQMKWKEIYVVDMDWEVVATGALADFGSEECPRFSISNFFIKPELQKHGIGRALFNKLYDRAKEGKHQRLNVPSSRNAVSFYAKMGFNVDEVQDCEADEITMMSMNIVR
jgi:N-acetylglutamate synthase-like GNAT family acetyltransferase